MFRSYSVDQQANKGKIQKIHDVKNEYRRSAARIAYSQWFNYYKNNYSFNKDREVNIESKLSARYKQCCQYQIIGMLDSYMSNIQNRCSSIIRNSSLDYDTKYQLNYINIHQCYNNSEVVMSFKEGSNKSKELEDKTNNLKVKQVKKESTKLKPDKKVKKEKVFSKDEIRFEGHSIDKEVLKLSRKIFKNLTKNKPSYRHIGMILNENVAKYEFNESKPKSKYIDKSKKVIETFDSLEEYIANYNKNYDEFQENLEYDNFSSYDSWITFSTLISGKPILIPVKHNIYYDSITGKRKNITQFNFDRNNNDKLSICYVKDVLDEKKQYIPLTPKISLDIGLCNLFVSSNGDIYANKMYSKLKEYDDKLTKLIKKLYNKDKNFKLKTNTEYNDLINSRREYIINEVNRVINRIIEVYRPAEIVIENLYFNNSNLSKKTNRLMNTMGKAQIEKKLSSIVEIYGIKITKINPAYTSQECNNCGYVDKNNRKNRDDFKCVVCEIKQHADVNGAKIIFSRSSWEEALFIKKETILDKLVKDFVERYVSAKGGRTSLNRKAVGVILKNPYFKNYWDYIKKKFNEDNNLNFCNSQELEKDCCYV